MNRRFLCISILAGSLAFAAAPAANAEVFDALSDPASAQAPTGRYLVKFAEGTSDADQAAALAAAGATDDSPVAALRLHSVALSADAADQLRADPSVARVEAEDTREATAVPNDPGYGSQWALPKIGWDQVFGGTPAGSATVALLDTGVDASHPDLAGNVVPGASILDPGANGSGDPSGHGTAMAGIVAAAADNGEGIAGVGYAGVKVMPVTVLDASGVGQDGDIISGVVWAADHGADVILMPFSSPDYSPSLQEAIDYAWSRGAVLVAATGNDSSSAPHFPAGDRGVVGVGNTDQNDALSSSSNDGQALFMAAPGSGIRTTAPGGGYTDISGTSASAAMVAGAAAVVKASAPDAPNAVVVGRLARNADATPNNDTGNGRLNLARAVTDVASDPVKPDGAAPVGAGGPFVGPYVAADNNDAHIAPGWAAPNQVVTFSTLYKVTKGGAVQHVRITLPANYSSISVPSMAFSSGTWSTPTINQTTRTIDVQLASAAATAIPVGGWARIDVTATTPPTNQQNNAADWLMETFTNTAGTQGKEDDNPPVLIGVTTDPSAAITFIDDSSPTPQVLTDPVLQNGVQATVRVRVTQSGAGIKYTDIAVPTCFSSPTDVTTAIAGAPGSGGKAYDPAIVTDGFIRLPGGQIPDNGTLTVTFKTTPNCTSGTYFVSSTPSTNATNPPSGTNQSVSTTGGSLTVAAGRADLSITKTDSPDPVASGGTLTYTLGVSNAGPDDASAVKVTDTLPAGTTFVSATGTNWNCNHSSGTVTCNRTGGNLAAGASAPNITIVVTAPNATTTITNSATVSSPNDDTPGNNTATATTTVGRADLSITKTDSPDPVLAAGTLTYTIGVSNAGPNAASAVKVVDTLQAGTSFVSATGTDWTCAHSSGTVTCDRTGNLASGASAPNITITVTAPGTVGTITNSATVSSPNETNAGNNTATATTTVENVRGVKFEDVNGNGTKDAGDGGLGGWTIRAYRDNGAGGGIANDGILQAGETSIAASATTAADGTYSLALGTGSYVICERTDDHPNFGQSGPSNAKCALLPATEGVARGGHAFTVPAGGATLTTGDFANYTQGTVSGTKFEDKNGDGVKDAGEGGLGGWEIYVDYDNDGTRDADEPFATTTAADGTYTISGIKPGTFKVREVAQTGWQCSHPAAEPNCFHNELFVSGSTKTARNFGNFKEPKLTISKSSVGGTGSFSFVTSGAGLTNFSLDTGTANPASKTTTFTQLGDKYVKETVPAGWDLTNIACSGGSFSIGTGTDASNFAEGANGTGFGDGDTTVKVTPASRDDVTCTFTNSKRATLRVKKDTVGGDGTFGFTSSPALTGGAGGAFSVTTVGGTKTEVFQNVKPGVVDVIEDDPAPGFDLTDLSCSDSGDVSGGSSVDKDARKASANLQPGEDVTCTFTNSRRATLTVVKKSVGGNDTFGFASDPVLPAPAAADGSFVLDTAGDGEDQATFENVKPGTVKVTEDDPTPAYDLTALECSDEEDDAGASTVTLGARQAAVSLEAGEHVTCTFTDTKRAKLTVVKKSVGGNDTFGFASDPVLPAPAGADGRFVLDTAGDGEDQATFENVKPGTVKVTEDDPTPAYDLTALECSDQDATEGKSTVSLSDRQASVSLEPGESVTCTFTDSKRATLRVKKDTVGGDGTFGFTSSPALTGGPDGGFQLTTVGGTKTQEFPNLKPGDVVVTEDDPTPAYDLTALECSDKNDASGQSTVDKDARKATASLQAGEVLTCTFTNTKRAKLTVVKRAVGGDGTFGFGSDPKLPAPADGDGKFSITTSGVDHQGEKVFENLKPGDVVVTEDDPTPGFDLTDLTCSDTGAQSGASSVDKAQRKATASLQAGEVLTCTFTNTKRATLRIKKDTVGGDGTFGFKSAPALTGSPDGAFSLTTVGGTKTQEFENLKPGDVDVTEDDPTPAYDLTALECSDKDDASGKSTVDKDARKATASLQAGEVLTCTFTNTKRAKLTVVKKSVGGVGTFGFGSDPKLPSPADADGKFSITTSGDPAQGEKVFENLKPGDVVVTEDDPGSQWDLSALECSDKDDASGNSTVDKAARKATASLQAGEVLTCTFTNTKRQGTVEGIKFRDVNSNGTRQPNGADNDPNTTGDNEGPMAGWTIQAFKDGDGNGTYETAGASTQTDANGAYKLSLDPGSYLICEMVKSNYVQTAPTNGKCASVSGAAAGGHAPISVSAGSSSLGNDFANAPFGSESTMTDSAFRLVDDLAPWTIGDFEILLNPKSPYDIVATNPGQFYYHQRATNTSGGSTNMSFTINWPCQFMTQTNGNGQPIHAYVQLPTDSANTWRDWTPQSSEISWANANVNPPTCNQKGTGPTSGEGKITVNNVPAGAKVWVNVHLDYALKGVGGLGSTFGTPPINYTPFKSKIVSPGGTSSSSGSLLGRGKKVTVVYGRTINRVDGTPLKNVWVRLGTPAKNVLTHTDDYGNYVFYEGQSCTLDGLDSCTGYTGTLTFVNGTTQTPLEIAGKDGTPAAAGSPAYPTGMTNFLITGGGTQFFPAPGTLPGYSTGPPTYTFGIAKNSAYSRNWKFAP